MRQLIQLKDASLLERFIRLLAGRTGQLVNHASLASDLGVDGKTVSHWLSILEASFIVFRLPPYFENFGKRVIKTPKCYFTEPGLLAHLLNIETAAQVARDPLVGRLFENLVVLEALKTRYNAGRPAQLYFFRGSHGNEIDLLHKSGSALAGAEIKAAATWNTGFKKNLIRFSENYNALARRYVVYRGEAMQFSDGIEALPYTRVADIF